MQAVRMFEHREEPEDDHIVCLEATWSDYQRFLELRGDRPVPRLSYLDGVVELMRPSSSPLIYGPRPVVARARTAEARSEEPAEPSFSR